MGHPGDSSGKMRPRENPCRPLRDSRTFPTLARHFRAGLSHAAAARLDLGRFWCAVLLGIYFPHTHRMPPSSDVRESRQDAGATKAKGRPIWPPSLSLRIKLVYLCVPAPEACPAVAPAALCPADGADMELCCEAL